MIGNRADRERLEEFVEVWTELCEESHATGAVILVEGEKDRRALVRLGVAAPVALVHRGQRLPALAQAIARAHDRAIVLTDWDRKGGQLAERLTDLLEGMEVHVDLEVRQRLARVLRGEVVHVEGLYRWATHLAEATRLSLAPLLEERREGDRFARTMG